ncbi:hypothetical protein SAMN05421736_105142 [Evansella caseinilytica]|uniref:Uncharacterized protein n=1 Tax=Evansella caseinilytica TaxID=1503961 RepID=A0A1H3PPF5_9BACI|nr:hypothetical protein [Evansella caseinilytica]SDZ02937.1 hypothetical protein SAMN05421736_105142 [Evansella caseinilytica]
MGNAAYYYDLCCKHKGKVVRICDIYGKEYVGKIAYVDRTYVWLEPTSYAPGYSYGWGWGYGGFFFPVALAAIGGFALGAAFFW